jgi:hypothetical protein
VHRLSHGDLTAFVSALPASRFGESALQSALADVEWMRDRVFAHDKVLAELRASGDVVPFRFCTIYRDASQVAKALARHRHELHEALDRVRGASEWAVKLFCDVTALRRRIETSGAIAQLGQVLADASPGAAFFLQKKYDRALDGEIAAHIASCIERSHQRLAACARETVGVPVQSAQMHGRAEEMIMNAACLLDEQSFDRFRQIIAALQGEFAEFGYELTGPWPPYHFVSTRQEGIDGAASPQ